MPRLSIASQLDEAIETLAKLRDEIPVAVTATRSAHTRIARANKNGEDNGTNWFARIRDARNEVIAGVDSVLYETRDLTRSVDQLKRCVYGAARQEEQQKAA